MCEGGGVQGFSLLQVPEAHPGIISEVLHGMGEQRIGHYLVMLDPLLGQTGGSLPSGLHPSHPGCHWRLLFWLGHVSFLPPPL